MRQPIWVPVEAVHIIHDRQIARHGGASGLRDQELLQNAMQRPVNKWQYQNADIFECAAAYAYGIAKAHAFVDGNKRTAFVTSATFLRLNGWHFVTEPAAGLAFVEGLASDEVSEEEFKNWLERGS
jgi:death-on-curing protein